MTHYRLPMSPNNVCTDARSCELRDIREALREMRLSVENLRQRITNLERCWAEAWQGRVDGLDGDWTVTPPPEWEE